MMHKTVTLMNATSWQRPAKSQHISTIWKMEKKRRCFSSDALCLCVAENALINVGSTQPCVQWQFIFLWVKWWLLNDIQSTAGGFQL